MNREYRIIQKLDVGRSTIKAFGRNWPVVNFMGDIQPNDVGKRIYLVGDILQVENNEQRDKRVTLVEKTYDVYWAPEGRKIATVTAKNEKAAIRKAPLPYRKFLGEMYAQESKR